MDLHLVRLPDNPGYNHFTVSVKDLDVAVEELLDYGIDVDESVVVPAAERRLVTIRDSSDFLV